MIPVKLTHATRHLQVCRDDAGIPHIRAASWLDCLYGLGYMHGVDRGTQLQFGRTMAAGQATEEIANSPELLETDKFFRKFGLARDLDVEVSRLDDHTFVQLASYSEGVNHGIAAAGRSLPMWATGFRPRRWSEEAVLLVGKLLSFGGLAVSQMQNERLLVELIHAGISDQYLRELFPDRLDNVDFDIIRQVKMTNQLSDDALELISDLPRLAGSNAWAVSPRRSATGSALLASDPHLEINRLPAIWYEACLQWDDRYLLGATLPGCPLFAVARNDQVAWGVTYMKGDTIDYFVEDCRRDPGDRWKYRRGDQWQPFRVRQELIYRKGTEPLEMLAYENDQGVLDGDPEELGEGYQLSVAWSGNAPGAADALVAWLDVATSTSAEQAMDFAATSTQPTLCWVMADRQGHIGLQGSGRFPNRGAGQIGLAPIPAWDQHNHWNGWLSADVLPRIYDPPEGFVATANEDVNPPYGPLLVTQLLPGYRKARIVERLAELPQATQADMEQLQYDLVSTQARSLLDVFLPHLPATELWEQLRQWDCRYDPESTGATLFMKLYRNVIMETFGHEEGIGWRRMLYICTRSGYSLMVLTAADQLLLREDSIWWQGRDKGELIRRAAERMEETEEIPPWSKVNNFHFTDRFFGNHQVGRMLGFNSGTYAMPGNHATVFQGHVLQTAKREWTFAPSYHFVTDMATDAASTNLPGGPSENRFSWYYNNDIARWSKGLFKALNPQTDADPVSEHEEDPSDLQSDS